MPRIHVEVVVAEGVTDNALRAGAGHYPTSPFPGEAGNVALAVQNVGGELGAAVRQLRRADRVQLSSPFATYSYAVSSGFLGHGNPWTISADDFTVIKQPLTGHVFLLTLTAPVAGHPNQRIAVRASLVPPSASSPCHFTR
ncbi:MAG: sortase [Actinomycetes bacterium]